jgi:hypothetical protein
MDLIFTLIYNSNGGFTFNDVYNMPVYMRDNFLSLLNKQKEKEEAAIAAAKGKQK